MGDERVGAVRAGMSGDLHERASLLMPGGVSSPVRSFGAVGARPMHVVRGSGCELTDADGNVYVDLICGWGAAIAGHAHHAVCGAIADRVRDGWTHGLSHPLEADLAERVAGRVPSVESVRFVNSGTEAVMSAVRLARASTGREVVVRFEGNYHGHADGLSGSSGGGGRPGVPRAVSGASVAVPYNDADALARAFDRLGDSVAAVVVEPIAGNMGLVPPEAGFLEAARRLATDRGALLIFDEVMTGFRVHAGGAQALLGVRPDLTAFGKIIGGGMPVGAYGGRRDLMELVAPSGPVFQAGTASGHPLGMAAGIATLDLLTPEAYGRLSWLTDLLAHGLGAVVSGSCVPSSVRSVPGMVGVFFGVGRVRDRAGASAADGEMYARFFRGMLRRGVLASDNSSAHRRSAALVIPEINGERVARGTRLVASPNCTTAIALTAVGGLVREAGAASLEIASYQAVSGAGLGAMRALLGETEDAIGGLAARPRWLAEPAAFNAFPHESAVDEATGMSAEEAKFVAEAPLVLGDSGLHAAATCVRVPTLRTHTVAIRVRVRRSICGHRARAAIGRASGVRLVENGPSSHDAAGGCGVLVGRVRVEEDPSASRRGGPGGTVVRLIAAGDQLLKGAAWNALQNAALLVRADR